MSTLQIDSVLLHEAEQAVRITPFVKQLGIDLNLPADFDEKEAYRKYLEEKYLI